MSETTQENRQRIGRELMAIRLEQGWSQEQVACMADVKEATIEKIEKGAFNVPLDILAKVADVLGYYLAVKPREE